MKRKWFILLATLFVLGMTGCGNIQESSTGANVETSKADLQNNMILVDKNDNGEEREFVFIDGLGKIQTYKGYNSMTDFKNGCSVVTIYDEEEYSSEYAVINVKGKQIIKSGLYDDIERRGNYFIVETDDGRMGVVNSKGKEMLMGEYEYFNILLEDKVFSFEVPEQDIWEIWLITENDEMVHIHTETERYAANVYTYTGLASTEMNLLKLIDATTHIYKYININTGEMLVSGSTDEMESAGEGFIKVQEMEDDNSDNVLYHIYALDDHGDIRAELSELPIKHMEPVGQRYYLAKTHDETIVYDSSLNELHRFVGYMGTTDAIVDLEGNVYFVEDYKDVITLYNEQFEVIKKFEDAIFSEKELENFDQFLYFPIKEKDSYGDYVENLYTFDGTLVAENAVIGDWDPYYPIGYVRLGEEGVAKVYTQNGEIIREKTEWKGEEYHFSFDKKYVLVKDNKTAEELMVYQVEDGKMISTFEIDNAEITYHFVEDMYVLETMDGYYTMQGEFIYEKQD